MSKIAFTGGSITSGEGFILPSEQDFMWVNLVHKTCFPNLEVINAGYGGTSNTDIFKETIKVIAQNQDLSVLICSWVHLLRYRFDVGFELYDTTAVWSPVSLVRKFDLNSGTISKKYVENLRNRFLGLHHNHYEICKLLDYINTINELCCRLGITVYHVNDSCPWDQDYFNRLENAMPDQYTNFTKTEILNIKNRDDEEIFKLYKKLHDEYALAGGVHNAHWINLYSSWSDNIIDTNHDNYHPGIQSNHNYYITVKNFLATQAY